ncbi:MAG: ATP synthase F1 subunit gamma [Acidobacteriota bacterium]
MSGNLIDLRRRIGSVKNTQKITRAMKTVSAAKLRKSVVEINSSGPILEKIEYLISRVRQTSESSQNPLMKERDTGNTVIVAISADKGLCGSFNSNIIKSAEMLYKEKLDQDEEPQLITIGKKASIYFGKRNFNIKKQFPDIMSKLKFNDAKEISDYLQDIFLNENIKEIKFVYTAFLSSANQKVSEKQLFPVAFEQVEGEPGDEVEYIFEPDPGEIFKSLLPKYINSIIFYTLLQSSASEHASRMVAMELATTNASEMISSLTLTMNKLRQASITKELLEIITATEALAK